MWKKADEAEKIIAREDLKELTERASEGEIDLVYFDQSGFNLWAKVVYAWQKRGERIEVPVRKARQQNVLGFMWDGCHRFESFVFEGSIDTGVVIDCFDRIAATLERETVIVIDNASFDGSREMVRAEFPKVRVIEMETNRGFAVAAMASKSDVTGRSASMASCTASTTSPEGAP